MIINVFLYACGVILMMAYTDAAPLYPKTHRMYWTTHVVVITWPLVIVYGLVLFCIAWVKEKKS